MSEPTFDDAVRLTGQFLQVLKRLKSPTGDINAAMELFKELCKLDDIDLQTLRATMQEIIEGKSVPVADISSCFTEPMHMYAEFSKRRHERNWPITSENMVQLYRHCVQHVEHAASLNSVFTFDIWLGDAEYTWREMVAWMRARTVPHFFEERTSWARPAKPVGTYTVPEVLLQKVDLTSNPHTSVRQLNGKLTATQNRLLPGYSLVAMCALHPRLAEAVSSPVEILVGGLRVEVTKGFEVVPFIRLGDDGVFYVGLDPVNGAEPYCVIPEAV